MASELRVTTIANNAGTESVGSTYVINGSVKSWVGGVNHTNQNFADSFNVSSYTDPGTGRGTLTLTSNMINAKYSVTHGSEQQYHYQANSDSTSQYSISNVNASLSYVDAQCNGMIVGDLA